MREALQKKNKISLVGDGVSREFIIQEVIGFGATCIVYQAYYLDEFKLRHFVKLKECFPLSGTEKNRAGKEIVWTEEEKRQVQIDRFIFAYRRQLNLQKNYVFVNTSCKVADVLYYGNNTVYMVIEADNGTSFDKIKPANCQSVFKILNALCKTIGKYHEIGLLHLDIKPQNFMVIPETDELVKLFDFDSLISVDDLNPESIGNISYTNDWAAPEVRQGRISKIAESADVFSVGMILFYSLFSRAYDVKDSMRFGNYDFESSELLKDVNPALIPALREFLNNTLAIRPERRFQNMEEASGSLEKLIVLADPSRMYLCSSMPVSVEYFAGRAKELIRIDTILQDRKTAYITGLGGLGKSELAKRYAYEYRAEYDQIIWVECEKDIRSLVLDNEIFTIANYDLEDDLSAKFKALKEVASGRTLIILDNLKTNTDPDLFRLLDLDAKFIITTRMHMADRNAAETIVLDCLKESVLESVFFFYYKRKLSEEEYAYVPEIIERLGYYTILIPLAAKQMSASSLLPSEMYFRLNKWGLGLNQNETFGHFKDNKVTENTMFDHLNTLFEVSGLSEQGLLVLRILSLLNGFEVGKKFLAGCCDLRPEGFGLHRERIEQRNLYFHESNKILLEDVDLSVINDLIKKGWILYDERSDRVSVHDVIGEWIRIELNPSFENCTPLWKAITYLCEDIAYWIQEEDENRNYFGHSHIFSITAYAKEMFLRLIWTAVNNLDVWSVEFIEYLIDQVSLIYACCSFEVLILARKIQASREWNMISTRAQLQLLTTSIKCFFYSLMSFSLEESREIEKRLFESDLATLESQTNLLELYFSENHYSIKEQAAVIEDILSVIVPYAEEDSYVLGSYLENKINGFEVSDGFDDAAKLKYRNIRLKSQLERAERYCRQIESRQKRKAVKDTQKTALPVKNVEDIYLDRILKVIDKPELAESLLYQVLASEECILPRKLDVMEEICSQNSGSEYLISIGKDYSDFVYETAGLMVELVHHGGIEPFITRRFFETALRNLLIQSWMHKDYGITEYIFDECKQFDEEYWDLIAYSLREDYPNILMVAEDFEQCGAQILAIRYLIFFAEFIDKGEYADSEMTGMPAIYDRICELAVKLQDSGTYYEYLERKRKRTGVEFDLSEPSCEFKEKSGNILQRFEDYLKKAKLISSKSEIGEYCSQIEKDALLNTELKEYLRAQAFVKTTCRLSRYYPTDLIDMPNMDRDRLLEYQLEQKNGYFLETIRLLSELLLEVRKTSDKEKWEKYLSLYWEQLEKVSKEKDQFQYIRAFIQFPYALWCLAPDMESAYYLDSIRIFKRMEAFWIRNIWEKMGYYDFRFAAPYIELLYNILKESEENGEEYSKIIAEYELFKEERIGNWHAEDEWLEGMREFSAEFSHSPSSLEE
ncbi:MAG: hypothetical protein IJ061_00120 [Lachnospiraceae bacterium]|nr:hypothetical protein [Lachnospiraceae bacterium]